MSDEPGLDLPAVAASTTIIVGTVYLGIRLLPSLTEVLSAIIPVVLILWFIIAVLRCIIRGLFFL